MILFSAELGIMISNIYGYDGSKELRAVAKKMRLDRDHLRAEGHPADEHYIVPAAKHATISARGVFVVSPDQFRTSQEAKRAQVGTMKPIVPTYRPYQSPTAPEDVISNYSSHARRAQDRGKNRRRPVAA